MTEAKILSDSISSQTEKRITSFLLKYPRFIHSEFLTHRAFSRNSPSSRAIPSAKLIENVINETALPEFWGKNQRGMQAAEEIDEASVAKAKQVWFAARNSAIEYAKQLAELGLHKQIANRLIEPFFHMTTLVTATEWGNFFHLRAHKDAQPEFQELAFKMLDAYLNSTPETKNTGEWHIVFKEYMPLGVSINEQLKIATARAARLSYLNFSGNIDQDDDFRLHDMLMHSGHWSPFEHCAEALDEPIVLGNFIGWKQYRKRFSNENVVSFNMEDRLREKKNNMGEMEKPLR